mmetsp:Transcript_44562/g.69708  ORF Transcript_44562/g.69708 Transcript_44562/m.69708 type:complete len:270 (-) Transcript_44562:126-935(-)
MQRLLASAAALGAGGALSSQITSLSAQQLPRDSSPRLLSAALCAGDASMPPQQVEVECSSVSSECSRIRAFFAAVKVPVKHSELSPLSGDSLRLSADGGQIKDVDDYVNKLRAQPSSPVRSNQLDAFEEQMWCDWAKTELVPAIMININRNPVEAKIAMDVAIKRGGFGFPTKPLLRHGLSFYRYATWKMVKRKAQIEDERIALNALLDKWSAAVGSRTMLGGNSPNMADLAVFGALHSIKDTPTFKEVLCQSGAGIWYSQVAEYVKMQ